MGVLKLQDHLRLKLLVNGVSQIETSSISVEFDSGAQRVDTLEGLAGKTPGSGSVTINVTSAVPIGGPEFDYEGACVRGDYVDMQVPFGAESYIGTGWFQTAQVSQSVNANTEIQFTWIGQFAEPE